jgi:hypothetical protein
MATGHSTALSVKVQKFITLLRQQVISFLNYWINRPLAITIMNSRPRARASIDKPLFDRGFHGG